jgi:hypothetical protein
MWGLARGFLFPVTIGDPLYLLFQVCQSLLEGVEALGDILRLHPPAIGECLLVRPR